MTFGAHQNAGIQKAFVAFQIITLQTNIFNREKQMGETSKYHRGDILLDPEAQLMHAMKVNLLPWQTYAILDSSC